MISAYAPEIDFGLARFSQGTDTAVSCQLGRSFECAGICCTYDNPTNNVVVPTPSCTVQTGAGLTLQSWTIYPESPFSDACINYAGSCGAPRRGADVLVGFERSVNQHLMWMDNRETNFINDRTQGDHCDFTGGGDCELRGTGPTPLADSLLGVKAFLDRTMAEDRIAGCRKYAVILLTDGVETCRGNPVSAAGELLSQSGLETYVIGFSVLPSEQASLNQIAQAGSLSGTRNAFFVGNEDELAATLASIVADAVVFEECNDLDDDCDGQVDEDFPSKGVPCHDEGVGPCQGTGTYQCRADSSGVECVIDTPGATPTAEVCDGLDNDCDGQVDEGLNCSTTCIPTGDEVCDGVDNDCNGAIDEADPLLNLPCGEGEGACEPGVWLCIGGSMLCLGGTEPSNEMCNGLDDDCDGQVDNDATCPEHYWCVEGACRAECGEGEFPCGGGAVCNEYTLDATQVQVCMPTACADCEEGEICVDDVCVDPCEEVTCEPNEKCILGQCLDCHTLGCEEGLVCYSGHCQEDPCSATDCGPNQYCSDGNCVDLCWDQLCPKGALCTPEGICEASPCADVDCAPNQYCNLGQCENSPCGAVYCPAGEVCIPSGECIPDPCPLLHCPEGALCEVNEAGSARCVNLALPPSPEQITSRGGCACTTGEEPEEQVFLGLFLLLALALIRRGGVA